jgi:hypothetical protein
LNLLIVKIKIFHIYWGTYPPWFIYFLESCRRNSAIDFQIFTDNKPSLEVYENIHFMKFGIDEFNSLASEKLGIPVHISNPYKICDFKPAFGRIFEDHLSGCDFWGYCDNDLIFGNISGFLHRIHFEMYDIISFYRGFLSGPFCIYRNSRRVIDLFMQGDAYKTVFTSETDTMGFDENIQRLQYKGFTPAKIILLFRFLFSELSHAGPSLFHSKELRYQYQWYFKRKYLKYRQPVDMTEIVWQAGKIRYFFREYLYSDMYFKRLNRKNWEIKWDKGSLIDLQNSRDMLAFHFVRSKTIASFKISKTDSLNSFYITEKGIH